MEISFPYHGIPRLKIKENNLIGIFSPSSINIKESEDEIIEKAFSKPFQSLPIEKLLSGKENVLIIVDDHTRKTPLKKILPRLIKDLEHVGIKKEKIKFLIGLGTHRPMKEEEMIIKFGEEIVKNYPIFNHAWWDRSQLIHLGETEKGTPIFVNRLIKEVDFIIGIGQIVPHRVSGFSGGANIVQPGICGEETTGKTHWLSAQYSGEEILGKIENPVKEEIENVAKIVGLNWIVNTIQDCREKLVGVVAGDPYSAYREGAKRSSEVYKVLLPCKADIVIIDSFPFDSELWLAVKGIYASELVVRPGGIVILITQCEEGISQSHPEILKIGYQKFEDVNQMLLEGVIQKLTVAAHLVHVGRVIKEKAKGILVSKGILKEQTEKIGFIYAKSPQEALEIGFSLLGKDAKVAILHRGGEILPIVKN